MTSATLFRVNNKSEVSVVRGLIVAVVLILLSPMAVDAQVIRVTSVFGPVEVVRAGSESGLVNVSADLQAVNVDSVDAVGNLGVGDIVRTGEGGQLTLELSDGSYIVVSENTSFEIEEYEGSGVRDLMNIMLGKVRFFIQKLGGRPNPYRVHTPTALIAVRGTEFDVRVGEQTATEVWTYEGRVTVEAGQREVILDAGYKTRVEAGDRPAVPVGLEERFGSPRSVQIVRTGDDVNAGVAPRQIPGALGDNDRRARQVDPLSNPDLDRTSPAVLRGKLSYPR